MFQKSPAQTAFWTFIESSRYITGLVIYWMVFQFILFIFSLRYFKRIFSAKNWVFKPNIFGGTPTFQKFYFRPNAEFSNQIFLATQGVFILSTLPFQWPVLLQCFFKIIPLVYSDSHVIPLCYCIGWRFICLSVIFQTTPPVAIFRQFMYHLCIILQKCPLSGQKCPFFGV